MTVLSLKKAISEAENSGKAIGHFNFAELTVLKAAFNVAAKLKLPVIVGTSESERDFLGQKLAVNLVKSIRDNYGIPIFINADHTKSFKKVQEAVEAGYDAILFDGGDLSFKENIKQTKKAVEYIKSKSPSTLVEGEIGYIGSSSKIHKKIPEGAAVKKEELTTPIEAKQFIEETRVDMLAPAVGSIHGIVKGYQPKLDIKRISDIKMAVGLPLVLHGASGSGNSDITQSIKAGISIVHISTEIRIAWRNALDKTLRKDNEMIAPYNILNNSLLGAEKVIDKYLRLFSKR